MTSIAIIGNTSWGNTVACMLAREGHDVRLLTRPAGERRKVLAHAPTHVPASDPEQALDSVSHVTWAVPSQAMRYSAQQLRGHLNRRVCHTSMAEGHEIETGMRMTEVLVTSFSPSSYLQMLRLRATGPDCESANLPTSYRYAFYRHPQFDRRHMVCSRVPGGYYGDSTIGCRCPPAPLQPAQTRPPAPGRRR